MDRLGGGSGRPSRPRVCPIRGGGHSLRIPHWVQLCPLALQEGEQEHGLGYSPSGGRAGIFGQGMLRRQSVGSICPALLPRGGFGVIPKGNTGKWRLILDLSSPEGSSVNDGVAPELCSMSYVSIDDAARAIASAGRGSDLAKVDIRQAYRIVPVHPEDRLLLGMAWDGGLFVDTALPFGLRSAPKVFTAIADALEWIVRKEGVGWVAHYLDDFLVVATSERSRCEEDLRKLLLVFDRLRIPIAPEKLEGPAKILTFLGIELDTERMTLRLPTEKIVELQMLITGWLGRKFCTLRDLQSLVGKLQHACKVVRPGRTFLRRMFELLKGVNRKQRFIRLNTAFRSDLTWWHLFMETWNGVAMMEPALGKCSHHLYTDASGTFGCGAWWEKQWFQFPWPQEMRGQSIAQKELLPILMACVIWGNRWAKGSVVAHCDNQAVVAVVNSGSCRDANLMQLLRGLHFVKAHFDISMKAVHIPGQKNVLADAISRDKLPLFLTQAPGANKVPTSIPASLVDLLVVKQPDWTSLNWSRLFTDCLRQVSPPPPEGRIDQGRSDI